jgi:hypothetical protein
MTSATHTHDEHSEAVPFHADEERELRAEDSAAWHDVVKILLGIISIGVILAVTCVYLTVSL